MHKLFIDCNFILSVHNQQLEKHCTKYLIVIICYCPYHLYDIFTAPTVIFLFGTIKFLVMILNNILNPARYIYIN